MNLPNEPQFPVAKLGKFAGRKAAYVVLPEVYRTLRRPVQSAEQVQQRALSRSGFPDQSKFFAAGRFQVQPCKNHQLRSARAVGFLQSDGSYSRPGIVVVHPLSVVSISILS